MQHSVEVQKNCSHPEVIIASCPCQRWSQLPGLTPSWAPKRAGLRGRRQAVRLDAQLLGVGWGTAGARLRHCPEGDEVVIFLRPQQSTGTS